MPNVHYLFLFTLVFNCTRRWLRSGFPSSWITYPFYQSDKAVGVRDRKTALNSFRIYL